MALCGHGSESSEMNTKLLSVFAAAALALTSVATVLVLATLPFWYLTVPDGTQVVLWTADTLPEALAGTLLAIPAALVTVALLRGMALAESALATVLLGGGDERAALL